jgi:GTP:adenosylcobinamide-phosphate guanylyltransferase
MTETVLILAGRRPGPDPLLAEHPALPSKALIEVAGRTMLSRVMEAVRGALPEAELLVSGLGAEWLAPPARPVPGADGPAGAVLKGAEGAAFPLLVTTADHALLSAETVTRFVGEARKLDAELVVGLCDRETIEARFPEAKRTFIRLSDKAFTGCNLFYLRSERALAVASFWRRLEAHRKKPLKLAREIGLSVLLRYAARILSTEGLFAHLGRRTGASIAAVYLPAEAAVDVDKPSDLELVEDILAGRG